MLRLILFLLCHPVHSIRTLRQSAAQLLEKFANKVQTTTVQKEILKARMEIALAEQRVKQFNAERKTGTAPQSSPPGPSNLKPPQRN